MNHIKQLYIWGAGHCGVLAALDLEHNGLKAAGFIDTNADTIKTRLGLPVLAPADVIENNNSRANVIIAVQNERAAADIAQKLESCGVEFTMSDIVSKTAGSNSYYTNPKRNSKEPPPPSTIPESLKDGFTMNGQIPVLYWYLDERNDSRIHNTAEDYERAFERMNNRTFRYYGEDINSFYAAFEKYSLKEKSVIVWGLAGLNCEAMAIWQGAKHVYVVDYNKPVCEHGKITVMNHGELVKSGIRADAAISFSSFEHDGLGRYGDTLNPNGDLEAMAAARDFLKDDGFMLFGVPQGEDCLVWNAHRIYGEKRLPLLLEGWDTDAVFEQESPVGHPRGTYHVQPLMVLCKSNSPRLNYGVNDDKF
ncbi:MAG: DUF268 domain-containing protein [Chitinispirillia bacterium]|nr:DUF268 domain-containing protein [Chitinispirillia bacterium]